ncbi:unnamed protein product [Dibothriocephalus latus]|uniref:Uncharacterized protein n=1 Tax=Dibothriocephalus latus TaxID=60516 RepID=A0A3P7PNN5_DIBLA|nr:unnamed protein product [Dibothriocephalus latus]
MVLECAACEYECSVIIDDLRLHCAEESVEECSVTLQTAALDGLVHKTKFTVIEDVLHVQKVEECVTDFEESSVVVETQPFENVEQKANTTEVEGRYYL